MANLLTNVAQVCADLTNIKASIQNKGISIDAGTPSSEYAEKIDSVYEAGQKAEYNRFWDVYQNNGASMYYGHAFSRNKFNDDNFKPKYDIKATNCDYMFSYAGYNTTLTKKLTDVSKNLEDVGVTLDTSQSTSFNYMFYVATSITRIPKIDITGCTKNIESLFTNASGVVTIDCLKLNEANTFTTASWGAPFYNCAKLKNITIEGTIGTTISFEHSPLTAKSIVSIVEHLSDSVTGKTVTFKQTAINNADWSTTNYVSWEELKATKPNWGFAYA